MSFLEDLSLRRSTFPYSLLSTKNEVGLTRDLNPNTIGYSLVAGLTMVMSAPMRRREARPLEQATETAMLSLITISVIVFAFSAWLLFNLTVHALPFFVGASAAFVAHQNSAGEIDALLVGLITAALTLHLAQRIFSATSSPVGRALIASIFAAPAVIAGYHAVLGLSCLTATSSGAQHVFAILGAIAMGAIAWSRIRQSADRTN